MYPPKPTLTSICLGGIGGHGLPRQSPHLPITPSRCMVSSGLGGPVGSCPGLDEPCQNNLELDCRASKVGMGTLGTRLGPVHVGPVCVSASPYHLATTYACVSHFPAAKAVVRLKANMLILQIAQRHSCSCPAGCPQGKCRYDITHATTYDTHVAAVYPALSCCQYAN
jgi:hypothetical protein